MALSSTAETELRNMLRAFRAAHGPTAVPNGNGKALEAWLLVKMAMEARHTGHWTVELRRGDGSPLPAGQPFDLPGGPSQLCPSNPSGPCFVHLQHNLHGTRLEIHGGLQWMGRSDARHECDVSVIPAEIAERLRFNGGGYPHGLPVAAIECKDKSGDGVLDETRQTLARMFDLALITAPQGIGNCRIFEASTNSRWGIRNTTYRGLYSTGTFAIARAGNFQPGARRLARHYYIATLDSIYGASGASVGALMSRWRMTLAGITTF